MSCCMCRGTSAQERGSKLSRSRHLGDEIGLAKMKLFREENHLELQKKTMVTLASSPYFSIFNSLFNSDIIMQGRETQH